jgi:hypothetical protein
VSKRSAWTVLSIIVAATVAGVFLVDPVRLGNARFWSDGATYYGMAWSLAEDGDLQYEARDILRVRREYPIGPQGIFLKRASGGLYWKPDGGFPWLSTVSAQAPRMYFAKAFIYPVAAAPLVRLFGTRGLLLTNVVFFALALCLIHSELARQTSPARALITSLAVLGTTVAPVYVLWQTPEIFNLGLITAGLVCWSRGRGWLAAILLGITTYSKYSNLLLAIPLGLQPFLDSHISSYGRRLLVSLRRGLLLTATVMSLFYLNKLITGESNYQGGERKTFHQKYFPLETREVTFGNSGEWMTTNELGPRVENQKEGWLSRTVRRVFSDWNNGSDEKDKDNAPHYVKAAGPARAAGEFVQAFWRNLGYFWIGRFGGAVWYFAPVVVSMLAFVVLGPRRQTGWLALFAFLASQLLYIRMIPDNWYGGSGTIGNRYFINLLPLVVFLIPRGKELIVALVGGVLGLACIAPILASPMWHSLHEGRHTLREPFRRFPLELTMLNDLSIFTERWRKKRPFGDMGDSRRPAAPTAYYLYFPDDGTYGKETVGSAEGFWLHGGREAEVILRALEPVRRVLFSMTGGPAGDVVTVRLGNVVRQVDLPANQTYRFTIDTSGGFKHYDTFIHIVRFKSRRGATVHDPEERHLGAFVRFRLEVSKRASTEH